MSDHLEQQLVNELRHMLKNINEKYKDFFHIQLLTLCDMKDQRCSECVASEVGQQCKRCVIGIEEKMAHCTGCHLCTGANIQ